MPCNNRIECTCTSTSCAYHGKCCQCIAKHRKKGEVPGCLFSEAGERTWDRSIANLYNDFKKQEVK